MEAVLPPGMTEDGGGAATTTAETVTVADPDEAAKVASPAYVTVRELVPLLNVPAGTLKLAVPLLSDCCAVNDPLERVTTPTGVADPETPTTVAVTTRVCWLVMAADAGITVTVEAMAPMTCVTVTVADCVAELYTLELAEPGT